MTRSNRLPIRILIVLVGAGFLLGMPGCTTVPIPLTPKQVEIGKLIDQREADLSVSQSMNEYCKTTLFPKEDTLFRFAIVEGKAIRYPRPVSYSPPVYPAAEAKAGRQALVWVAFIVQPDGTTANVKFIEDLCFPANLEFAAAAATAVSHWRFEPGKIDGVPVPIAELIPMSFKLVDRSNRTSGSSAGVVVGTALFGGEPQLAVHQENLAPSLQSSEQVIAAQEAAIRATQGVYALFPASRDAIAAAITTPKTIKAPAPEKTVDPVWPPEAVDVDGEIDVRLAVLVGADGIPIEVKPIADPEMPISPPILEAAEQCVRQWRFWPGTIDGARVPFPYAVSLKHYTDSSEGQTALMLAASHGRIDEVRTLLGKGADKDARDSEGGTALMFAAEHGYGEVAQALLAGGANAAAIDNGGITALMIAVRYNRADVVRILLAGGAGIEGRDKKGHTALMFAADWGYRDIVQILLAAGADPNAANVDGCTALMIACHFGRSDAIRALLAGHARVDTGSTDGWTALMFAAEAGCTDGAKALLQAGADVNAANARGWTALTLACYNGRSKVVPVLLRGGARIDAKNQEGWTALMLAAQQGYGDIARLLLAAGAKVEATNARGWTALLLASSNGHLDVVRILIDGGADIDAQNYSGYTALDLAVKKGHADVAAFLRSRGA